MLEFKIFIALLLCLPEIFSATLNVTRFAAGDVYTSDDASCLDRYANETLGGRCRCPNQESLIYEFDTLYCDDDPIDTSVRILEHNTNVYYIRRDELLINGTMANSTSLKPFSEPVTCLPHIESALVLNRKLHWQALQGTLDIYSMFPLFIKVNVSSYNYVRGRLMFVNMSCDYDIYYTLLAKFQGNYSYEIPMNNTFTATTTQVPTSTLSTDTTFVTPWTVWAYTTPLPTTHPPTTKKKTTTTPQVIVVTSPQKSSDSTYIIVIGVCVGIVGILIGIICTLLYRKRKKRERNDGFSMAYKKDFTAEDNYPGYVPSPTKLPSDAPNGFYSAYLSTGELEPRKDIPRTFSTDRPITPRPSEKGGSMSPPPIPGNNNSNNLFPNYSYPDAINSGSNSIRPRPKSPRPMVGPLSLNGKKDSIQDSYVEMKGEVIENEYGENYVQFSDPKPSAYEELSKPSDNLYELNINSGEENKESIYQPIEPIEPDLYE